MPARVLVAGPGTAVTIRAIAKLRRGGYDAVGARSLDEAGRAMTASPDALVVVSGVALGIRVRLIASFSHRCPGRPIIEHSGGPALLLDLVTCALRR